MLLYAALYMYFRTFQTQILHFTSQRLFNSCPSDGFRRWIAFRVFYDCTCEPRGKGCPTRGPKRLSQELFQTHFQMHFRPKLLVSGTFCEPDVKVVFIRRQGQNLDLNKKIHLDGLAPLSVCCQRGNESWYISVRSAFPITQPRK